MIKLSRQLIALYIGAFAVSSCAIHAREVEPKLEFQRALAIIANTQLDSFTETRPESIQTIVAEFEALEKEEAARLDDTQKNYDALLGKKRIDIMRTLLSRTIDTYNDQYANYISPAQLQRYTEKRTGNYRGVGLKFRTVANDYPIVIGAIVDGPLHHSDLLPGDKIIAANGTDLKNLKSSEIVSILKGPDKTTVKLSIKRSDSIHDVIAERGAVNLKYARSTIIDQHIGYIKISRFGGKTHETVGNQLKELLRQKIDSVILDLRDNPGGSTRAARAIVSMFIKEQHIYCERNKSGKVKQLTRHGSHLTNLPLIVLVNNNSMSASEIVAGALQSYQRATVIGSPTFGKGLVQRVFNLDEPLGGAIRTTIAEFGRPDHQLIHATGIVPDIYLETPADFMFRRSGSLNIKDNARAYQRTLLEQAVRKKHPDKADTLINAPDAQLNKAIDELNRHIKSSGL